MHNFVHFYFLFFVHFNCIIYTLKRIGIENPRIAVAGLNSHVGESGIFGNEEIDKHPSEFTWMFLA